MLANSKNWGTLFMVYFILNLVGCDPNQEDQLQAHTKFFAIEILRLLNANAKSVLPSIALKCILSWLNCFSPEVIDDSHHEVGTRGVIQRGTSNVSRRYIYVFLQNIEAWSRNSPTLMCIM